jgi:hypothetical protein
MCLENDLFSHKAQNVFLKTDSNEKCTENVAQVCRNFENKINMFKQRSE